MINDVKLRARVDPYSRVWDPRVQDAPAKKNLDVWVSELQDLLNQYRKRKEEARAHSILQITRFEDGD